MLASSHTAWSVWIRTATESSVRSAGASVRGGEIMIGRGHRPMATRTQPASAATPIIHVRIHVRRASVVAAGITGGRDEETRSRNDCAAPAGAGKCQFKSATMLMYWTYSA